MNARLDPGDSIVLGQWYNLGHHRLFQIERTNQTNQVEVHIEEGLADIDDFEYSLESAMQPQAKKITLDNGLSQKLHSYLDAAG